MTTHTSSNPGSSSSSLSSTFSHYWSGSSSCSSPLMSPSSNAVDVAAFVPFLWEEKPGISKQFTQNKERQIKGDPVSQKSETFVLIHVSAKQHDLIVSPTNELSLEVRPLRPPPSMQNSSQFGHSKPPKAHDLSGTRVLSHSFPRGRQPRKLRHNDDPFLLAMEACTKPADPDSDPNDTSTRTVRKLLRKNSDQSSWPSHLTSSTRNQGSGKRVIYANLKSFPPESENSATTSVMSGHVPAMYPNSAVNIYSKGGQEKRRPNHSGTSQVENYCQAQEVEKTRRTESPNQAGGKLQDSREPNRDRLAYTADTAPSIQSSSVRKFNASHSRGRQSQSVELSCGQHRRLPPPTNNRQPVTAWFGCRSINNFEGAIVPLKSSRPLMPERSRSARQESLDVGIQFRVS